MSYIFPAAVNRDWTAPVDVRIYPASAGAFLVFAAVFEVKKTKIFKNSLKQWLQDKKNDVYLKRVSVAEKAAALKRKKEHSF